MKVTHLKQSQTKAKPGTAGEGRKTEIINVGINLFAEKGYHGTTLDDIAEQVGRPGAARAVGTALSRNPFPLVIPCHRCVRSDGSVGGFRLPGLKERLLRLEGHRIEDGVVSAYGRGRPALTP